MRALVTGVTAPLGGAVVRALLADPTVEHVLGCGFGGGELPAPIGPRFAYHAIDLRRPRGVHDLVRGEARRHASEVVIHTALHRRAHDEGTHVHAQNVGMTRELLLACEHHVTVRRFVFRSAAEVYAIRPGESDLLDEDAPLEFDPSAPQWVRDRVAADLTVCARMATSNLSIMVLRCAEVLAPGTGGQLWDYLQSRVCLRPLGFDPMVNVLSLDDAVRALRLAAAAHGDGIFNIPGADTLPLSSLARRFGRRSVPFPAPLLAPAYDLRGALTGRDFSYRLNLRRFHVGGIVDGAHAADRLGYRPLVPIRWPA